MMKLFESDVIRTFAKNVGITGLGALIVGFLGTLSTLIMGRLLGPAQFGAYNVTLSVAQLLVIPLVVGLPSALTHALPRSKNRAATVSSVVPVLGLTLTGGALIYSISSSFIAQLAHLPRLLIYYAIVLSVVYSLRYIADGIMRGSHQFSRSAVLDIGVSLVGFLLLGILLGSGYRHATVMLVVVTLTTLAYAVGGFWFNHQWLGWGLSPETKHLVSYGSLTVVISTVQIMMLQADRLIINYFYHETAVGVYSGYLSGALLIIAFVFTITNYVLFPTSSAYTDISSLLKRLNKWCWVLIAATSLAALGTSIVFVFILGPSYGHHRAWLLLASLYAGFYFYANVTLSLAFSRGTYLLKKITPFMVCIALIFLPTAFYSTQHYGISGMFMTLIITYALIGFVISRTITYNSQIL